MISILCKVVESKIQTEEALRFLGDPGHGAQTLFLGVVRNLNLGREVLGVSYDAHPALTESTFQSLCEEAQSKWGQNSKIVLIHRIGRLEVGEISVLIGTSSRHRDEAYLISRFLIEELKLRAPIWKKEHYTTGESEWLQGHALCTHATSAIP